MGTKGKGAKEADAGAWEVVRQALFQQLDHFELEPESLKPRLVDQLLRRNSEAELKQRCSSTQ